MYNALCCDVSIVVFPMFVEKFPPWTVHTLEGMSSEIITHRLNHIGRGMVGGQTQKIIQRCGKYRYGQSFFQHDADVFLPRGQGFHYFPSEMLVQQQMRQSRCTVIGLGNVVQESGTDNASGTPQQGDGGKIQFPAILLTGSAYQSKPLRLACQTSRI